MWMMWAIWYINHNDFWPKGTRKKEHRQVEYEQAEDWSEGLSSYTHFVSPKKTDLNSMQLFSADPTIFSKKEQLIFPMKT